MGRIYKVGATITPTLDSERDYFGATGFQGSYINKANGVVTSIPGDFTEIMLTVSGNTSTVNGIAVAGLNSITVVDGSQFSDGDVIQDENSNKYYLLNVDGNVLETKQKLAADVADGSTITQVGNTGLYANSFSISLAGEYNILVANPSINMQNEIIPVSIANETIDDVQTKLDDIKTEMGLTKSEVKFRAYV
jgi:hypothetical protein